MVQHWVKELQSVTGLAPATIETIYVIFASIMRGAVRDGYIRKTPCDDIRLPEVVATVVRLLTPVQVLTLADAMPRHYAPLVLLGAIAGLRQGEAFGLALDRIDSDTGMITVDQQVVIVDRRPAARPGGRCSAATTTTARSGSLPWPPPGFCLTLRSTICGTPSPAPPSPRACQSRRYPAGSGTSRSRPPWTSTAIWSRGQRPGPRCARQGVHAAVMCPQSALAICRIWLRSRSER
jgi:hypothetical protein